MTSKFELGRYFVHCTYPRSFIILCLLVRKLSCWQTNKHTHTQTNSHRWKHPTFFATLRLRGWVNTRQVAWRRWDWTVHGYSFVSWAMLPSRADSSAVELAFQPSGDASRYTEAADLTELYHTTMNQKCQFYFPKNHFSCQIWCFLTFCFTVFLN